MLKKILFLIAVLVIFSVVPVKAIELSRPELFFHKDNTLSVTFSFKLDQSQIEEIRQGLTKEYIVYIDLFRYWDIWPDEFITGKKISKSLRADPVKGEFVARSFDGSLRIKKRFKSIDSMLKWVSHFKDLALVNLDTLPEGRYFVKVTVESKARNIPSLISELFFFLPVKEFSISTKSRIFNWPPKGKTGK
ncbi:MAG: DUF4390 domain-containing protein [Nitrospirae bacterium]|nr:DUF4390 domain-containing protein [Nitrospirota bacterium]